MKISSSDIAIVVQGPIYNEESYRTSTVDCLTRLREIFPHSQIILSTWISETVSSPLRELVDELVLSQDPGDATPQSAKKLNINRQIVSTKAGLDVVARPFIIKTRTDILFKSDAILKAFLRFNDEVLGKVLVYNFSFRDPRKSVKIPWWICDYIYLARADTIQSLFQVRLFEITDFNYNTGKDNLKSPYAKDIVSRFNPEVYLGIRLFYSVTGTRIRANDLCEVAGSDMVEFLAFCARSLIILDERVGEVSSIKGDIPFQNKHVMYSHESWKVDAGYAGKITYLVDKLKFHAMRIRQKWGQYVR